MPLDHPARCSTNVENQTTESLAFVLTVEGEKFSVGTIFIDLPSVTITTIEGTACAKAIVVMFDFVPASAQDHWTFTFYGVAHAWPTSMPTMDTMIPPSVT